MPETERDQGRRRVVVETPTGPVWGIVLLGRFNPAIFQPAWLASHKLIRPEEAEKAKGVVFAPEVAAFTADWLRVQVTEDRFEADAFDAAYTGPLKDLVIGIFALLEHTPFDKMGLNHHGHYPLAENGWKALEEDLVSKAPWTRLVPEPRLRALTMEGDGHERAPGSRLQVRVEPSQRVEGAVWIATNEHYARTGADAGRELMAVLASRWESALAYAKQVVDFLTTRRT